MRKKIGIEKINIALYICVILGFFLIQDVAVAKWSASSEVKLTMENFLEASGVATLRLVVIAGYDTQDADIGCFLPLGVELVNNEGYKVISLTPPQSTEEGNNVKFYSGPMKKGDKKEFVFKLHITDGRKYTVGAGGLDGGDYLEIDLDEPEPPEWGFQNKESVDSNEEKPSIPTGIKRSIAGKLSSLDLPEGTPPPLRTELRIRTKNKPYIMPPYNSKEIPLRYLIYTEEEVKEANITVELPEGLEPINDQNYKIFSGEKEGKRLTMISLFQGPMQLKESKAFYFNVCSGKNEHFRIKVQARVLTYDDKEFVIDDFQDIELGKVLY